MNANADVAVEEAVIVIRRVFDAPRSAVWRAITEPKHVMHWFGGTAFTNMACDMDVRPGGLWRHVMRAPDGTEITCDFVYLEVDVPKRLVWKNSDGGQSGRPASVTTVTLDENGGRTEWKLVARFNSIADRDQAVGMGFSETISAGFDQLDALLKTL